MGQPYIGEIRLFGGNFAPAGWAFCMGQLIPISENDTLFALIGTTYGGDGLETFALPNLAGRVPIHFGTRPGGSTYIVGQMAGTEQVTLNSQQIPIHTHGLLASINTAGGVGPQSSVVGQSDSLTMFRPGTPSAAMSTASLSATGGSQPHENMQPYLGLSFIIALFGIFPTQS